MFMKNIWDLHVHTRRSFDSEELLEAHCSQAEELGLSGFAITDHCDVNLQPLSEAVKIVAGSAADVRRLREGCSAEILTGVELGEPLEDPAYAEEILALEPYDVVLGSIHNLPGMEDFSQFDYTFRDLDALLKPYYEELIRLAQWGKCDVITHITYPLRYMAGDYGRKVDLAPYGDLIDELFRTIIQKGLVLEINSSGLRQKLGRSMPDEPLLRRYYQLGGRRISFGSDAHRAADLAAGIPECMETARRIGFTETVLFRNRKIISVPLGEE